MTPDPEVCEDGWTGATPDSDWVNLDVKNDTLEVASHNLFVTYDDFRRRTRVKKTLPIWFYQE